MTQLSTLITSLRSNCTPLVDQLVVNLSNVVLRRRDAILSQVDKNLPDDVLLDLRHASFLSDRLFEGKISEASQSLVVHREKSAVGEGLRAVAEATQKQTAALSKPSSSTPSSARRSLFSRKSHSGTRHKQPFQGRSSSSSANPSDSAPTQGRDSGSRSQHSRSKGYRGGSSRRGRTSSYSAHKSSQ